MLCHAVRGTTADGRTGPDLTHVASRKTLAAGRLPNDAQTMTQWITDPQQFKPGTNMPAHALPAAQMQALVAYVESLK
jgi:cytochrome c oxidase subunit 2